MVHENKITGWKDSLRRAFGVWVRYVEARYSAGGMEEALYTVGIPFAQLGAYSPFFLTSKTLMIGSILLLSDTEMIRIFAGAASTLPVWFILHISLAPSLSWRSTSHLGKDG